VRRSARAFVLSVSTSPCILYDRRGPGPANAPTRGQSPTGKRPV
jgi:hypothetical protein